MTTTTGNDLTQPQFHIVQPKDRKRIWCNHVDCSKHAYACEHSHWNTGNTTGVSFYYSCRTHTPDGIKAAIRHTRALRRAGR